MAEEVKKEETKIEEQRIDIPLKFLEPMKEIQKNNLEIMNQFVGLCEHYFALQRQINDNVEKRVQNGKRLQSLLDHTFKKMRLDNKQKWQYDLHKGQFFCVKRPEVGPAIYKEETSESIVDNGGKNGK